MRFIDRVRSAIKLRWDALFSRLRFIRPFSLSWRPRDWQVTFLRARVRELEAKESEDIKYLRFQLTRTRAENIRLQNQVQDSGIRFAALFHMPEEDLHKAACRYEVYPSDDGGGWTVVVEHCVFCGCAVKTEAFQSERDALLYTALLQTAGFRPRNNLSCSQCYSEYLKSSGLSVE